MALRAISSLIRNSPLWLLAGVACVASAEEAPTLKAVSTYESIGIYWEADGQPGARANVRYRESGGRWKNAQSLEFDVRVHTLRELPVPRWRGSIVGLRPETTYDIEVEYEGKLSSSTVRTWSEAPRVARTVGLNRKRTTMLVITDSGTPDGYVLYRPRSKAGATIDVGGREAHNILINASFVIIRGLHLVGAEQDAIKLGPRAHNVIIEDNDVSGWGRIDKDGFGMDRDAAIGSVIEDGQGIRQITIQGNRIHDPRGKTNSWAQRREVHETNHPLGPHGVFLWDTGGNHVIRHNEFFTTNGNLFNDVIGGGENFHLEGAPGRDSDIYGNSISDCMDDGIESEGGNMNVRIWANRIDRCYVAIAATPTHIGPLYVFRNIALGLRYTPRHPVATGVFMKLQSKKVRETFWGGGRVYVYHNTVRNADGKPGAYAGITPFGTELKGVTSRNNIFDVTRTKVDDPTADSSNYYDLDVHYTLGSRGLRQTIDQGVVLPNFNDGFRGAAPDLGAEEERTPKPSYGRPRP